MCMGKAGGPQGLFAVLGPSEMIPFLFFFFKIGRG